MSDLEKMGSNSKRVNGATDVEQSSFVTVDPAAERSYGEHVFRVPAAQIADRKIQSANSILDYCHSCR